MEIIGLIVAIYLVYLVYLGSRFGFIEDAFFYGYVMYLDESKPLYRIFTEKSPKLDGLLQEVTDTLRLRGFDNLDFEIRFVSRMVLAGTDGRIILSPQRIFIYKSKTGRYSDDDLRILIAHEIGYAIYKQGVKSHSAMEKISKINLNEDDFADLMAIYVYGKEMFLQSYGRIHFKTDILNRIDAFNTYSQLFIISKAK